MKIGNREIQLNPQQRKYAIIAGIVLSLFVVFFVSARLGGLMVKAPPVAAPGKGGVRRVNEKPIPIEPPVVYPEDNAALPTGVLVMIDNQEDAWPQSGVDKADLVFEIIAEGGITRLMALFHTEEAAVIGPVRSARYYFVQLAAGLDLPYAHVGGSTDGISMIGQLNIKDINEISNSAKYFWQDPARRRPHSTYTSTENLLEAVVNKKFAYKVPDLPPYGTEFTGEALTGKRVGLTYATGRYGYKVEWFWQEDTAEPAGSGRYYRYINGKAHMMADGTPLVADTIFVLAAKSGHRNTDPITSYVEIIGSGEALCIVDNQIIRGTWKKESPGDPLLILDGNGQPMTRKIGKTWIQVVEDMNKADFAPGSPG